MYGVDKQIKKLRGRLLTAALFWFLLLSIGVACQGDQPPDPTETISEEAIDLVEEIPEEGIDDGSEAAPEENEVDFEPQVPLTAELAGSEQLDAFPAYGRLVVEFNETMDVGSPLQPLIIVPSVAGTFSWQEDGHTVEFSPERNLGFEKEYEVRVNPMLKTVAGETVGELPGWTLTTTTGPKLLRVSPTSTLIKENQPQIQLIFSQPVDYQSVIDAVFTDPPLDFEVISVDDEDTVFQLALQEGMESDQNYIFFVEPQIKTTAGIPLNISRSWEYTLAPLIQRVSVPDEAHADRPLTVYFNYAIDEAELEDAFVVEPAVAGEITMSGTQTAVFTPISGWASRTEYSFRLEDSLETKNGILFEPPPPLSFGDLPVIVDAAPRGERANPTGLIVITFDRPMDKSATESQFNISPELSGQITWEGEAKMVFEPEERFMAHYTEYTVSLREAFSAEGEQLLDQPYTWNFRTQSFEVQGGFGWGPNIQQLQADGPRSVQFFVDLPLGSETEFELLGLNQAQFIERYSSGFRGVAGYDKKLISLQGTTPVTTWSHTVVESPVEYGNVQETNIPGDIPTGLYILNLRINDLLTDQLLVTIGEQTMTVKRGDAQLTTWVSDFSGNNLPDTPVFIVDRSGQEIASGRTDSNGVYIVDLEGVNVEPLMVIAGEEENQLVTGLTYEWRSSQGSRRWWEPETVINDFAAHVYTNRPIYKPGETVFYKAIIRLDDDAVLDMVPADTPVTVRLRDARNNVVLTQERTTNSFGSINGDFQLADGAMSGEYVVEIDIDGERHSGRFSVQDYRKPEYSVEVTASAERLVSGQEVELTIDSQYFFGEPVAEAQVSIQQLETYRYYDWETGRSLENWASFDGSPIEGRTDENGLLTISVPVRTVSEQNNGSYYTSGFRWIDRVFQATVEDGSGQSTAGSVRVRVYENAEGVSLSTNGYLHQPDNPVPMTAVVTDYQDKPVVGRELRFTLSRWDRSSREYSDVRQTWTATTDSQGSARIDGVVQEEGSYRLRVSGIDAAGHSFSYSRWIYVYSGRSRWFGRQNQDGFNLQADQETYAPGDTAQLIIESPVSGPALLMVERGSVRRVQSIVLESPVTTIELPIIESDGPNIYVSINTWEPQEIVLEADTYYSLSDSRLLSNKIELKVPVTDKQLEVVVQADRETYAPGDEAEITVRVTNQKGEPVSAELSLAMVDEALFALADDLNGPMFDSFYFDRKHLIDTFNALHPSRYLGFGGRGGGGNGGISGQALRIDFPDAVIWEPVLQTDANGEAVVKVTIPDSLTTWRLTAKAFTADTQVGEGIAKVIVRRDIVVRPFLPDGLTAGDRVVLSAMIQNFSDQPQTLDVTINSENGRLVVVDDSLQTITLDPNQSQIVGWQLTAEVAGRGEITIEAGLDGVRQDGVRLPLDVRPLAVLDQQSETGTFIGEKEVAFEWSGESLEQSSVQIDLSRSVAGTLLEGLEYLTGFPYGCVEQTMSRALPNAVVGRVFNQLGVSNPTMSADLPAQINAGIQRLYGYQHQDGGWGWWYDDASDDYQTAWVIFGLVNTREAGYEVDEQVIGRGVAWLGDNLDTFDSRTRAFALYSMAISGVESVDRYSQDNYQEVAREAALALLEDRSLTDAFSQTALILTLWELGEEELAGQRLANLADEARTNADGQVFWLASDQDGAYYRKTMASTVRSTAFALSAFSKIDPQNELIPGMVEYLMDKRTPRGWGTTNETAFTIIGLTDHLLATSFRDADTATGYELLLNGVIVAEGLLGRGEPAVTIEIPAEELESGLNTLVMRQTSDNPLFFAVNRRQFVAESEIEAAGAITIDRQYLDLDGQPIGEDELLINDYVVVELEVRYGETLSYVIIEDKLPAGLEALNEGLNTTSYVPYFGYEENPNYQVIGYNHKDIQDGRVSFFITEMAAGKKVIRYTARVTHAGTFVALPAEVYPMYDEATWGRSASNVLVVKE
ncbi:MAG: MG2 domain-containing protein [Ardenticatenaceae bacterium]|nr:MG2 domain-containing protein [Ardenticatenaceae bacterium]